MGWRPHEALTQPNPTQPRPLLGSGPGWQPRPCYLTLAVLGVPKGGTTQSSYTNPFHVGDGQQVHYLWGEEAQKGKNRNKIRGGRA